MVLVRLIANIALLVLLYKLFKVFIMTNVKILLIR